MTETAEQRIKRLAYVLRGNTSVTWGECQAVIRALIADDLAHGVVAVPVEATLEMLNTGWEKMFGETAGPTSEVWAAMLAASPFIPEMRHD